MRCPNCGTGILEYELIDTYLDSDYVEEMEGTCPHCHRKYRWENIYVFFETNIIEEISVKE